MRITVEALVRADLDTVWEAWHNPDDITQWGTASADWHTPSATIDLREGGTFVYRMEAKDGSAGFDFAGTFTRIVPKGLVKFTLDDGRDVVVEFRPTDNGVMVRETFDAETSVDAELQRAGWQAIMDNFARHVEGKLASDNVG